MINYYICTLSPLILYLFTIFWKKKIWISSGKKSTAKRKKTLYLLLMGLIIAFFLGFRSKNVGSGDGRFYFTQWERLSAARFGSLIEVLAASPLEIGYTAFVFVLSHVFRNGQWVFIFQGMLVAYAVCRFTYRYSDNYCLALMAFMSLGLFSFSAQGVRQSMAMSICLFAIDAIRERKLLRFVVILSIAASFHGSAVVFAPLYFVYGLRMNAKGLALCIIGIVIVNYALPILFDIVNLAINDDYVIADTFGFSGGGITSVIHFSIVACGLFFRKKINSRDNDFFLVMALASWATFLMRFFTFGIAERVSLYYMASQMVVISNILRYIKRKDRIAVSGALVALMIALIIHKAGYTELIPYKLFWQSM